MVLGNTGLIVVQPPDAAASLSKFHSVKVLFSGKIHFIRAIAKIAVNGSLIKMNIAVNHNLILSTLIFEELANGNE